MEVDLEAFPLDTITNFDINSDLKTPERDVKQKALDADDKRDSAGKNERRIIIKHGDGDSGPIKYISPLHCSPLISIPTPTHIVNKKSQNLKHNKSFYNSTRVSFFFHFSWYHTAIKRCQILHLSL